ncbi:MAG TPA: DnaJ domain-containing protein [Thermoanaerobaculia bacterium]|nr:DnaJ domain-containing protein [Thermoanaerobaculia bacterium]
MIGGEAPTAEQLRQFSTRIARSLAERPYEDDPATHRAAVAQLVGNVGMATCYELLGLSPLAREEEVHDGYERLARRVHPSHAGVLGLAGREGVLDLLFERATAAYLTLSQPDRRRAYDRDLGLGAWDSHGASPRERREEAQRLARELYERASALASARDYHFAVELVAQAVRADPRPEYYALLGQVQAQNPNWLRLAAENLRRAVDLGHRDVETSAALRQVREQLEAAAATGEPPRWRRSAKGNESSEAD